MAFRRGFNMLTLKIIAFAGTVCLNLAWCGLIKLLPLQLALSFIGASSLTLIAFAANEAVKKTSNLTKYLLRLLVLAAVCAFPYFTVYRDLSTAFRFSNYLSGPFAVFFIAGVFSVYDKLPYKWMKTGTVILFVIVSAALGIEYAPVSVIFALFIHCYDSEPQRKFRNFNIVFFSIVIAAVCAVMYFMKLEFFKGEELLKTATLSGAALSVPLINNYNGENNSFTKPLATAVAKYAFYFAYVALIGSLALIKYFAVTH